jgi:peptidoglycan hydrolase-like protein with peptidoglycan-binding domain
MSEGSSSRSAVWIAVAIVVAGAIIAGAVYLTRGKDEGTTANATPTATPTSTSTSAGGVVDPTMNKDDVETLQRGLAQYGFYKGAIDGIYGPQTEAAVKGVQEKLGVTPADGIWGPATWAAVQKWEKAEKGKAQQDQFVVKMQSDLKSLGYYKGQVDGVYGSETTKAIEAFQKDHNLPVTGKLDNKTVYEINKAMETK